MRHARLLLLLCTPLFLLPSGNAYACGGFFCQSVPIDQAGEQIIFRQQGQDITAMVRILYQGEAENFSWVVPVPTSPELSVGADRTFDELDLVTRPQFLLERRGNECTFDIDGATTDGSTVAISDSATDGGVTVEQTLSVGPFDIQVVSSDNPDDLALWLQENDYDLSDRGRDLIAPYVEDGMKFVALKLRSGQTTGSIQPLIMRYQSTKPMIPIRLTAVAAQDDMGVLAWIVGDARAVPDNYLHVTPNYTRLNWYVGPQNAYASYQTLITEAMNTAGGQGFATDVAGRITSDISAQLTTAAALESELGQLDTTGNDAEFISNLLIRANNPALTASLQPLLPLPDNQGTELYFDQFALQSIYTSEELANARSAIRQAYLTVEIEPLRASVNLLPEGAYMTRLYTTLSADEMTLDPTFEFNSSMPDQPLRRQALLESRCGNNGTEWTLTLGAGTGREGEQVISANIDVPFSAPAAVASQRSTWRIERTSGDAMPDVTEQTDFELLQIASDGSATTGGTSTADDDDDGFLGSMAWFWPLLAGAALIRRRQAPKT